MKYITHCKFLCKAKVEKEDEKSYEVLSLQCSTHHEVKEILTSHIDGKLAGVQYIGYPVIS